MVLWNLLRDIGFAQEHIRQALENFDSEPESAKSQILVANDVLQKLCMGTSFTRHSDMLEEKKLFYDDKIKKNLKENGIVDKKSQNFIIDLIDRSRRMGDL